MTVFDRKSTIVDNDTIGKDDGDQFLFQTHLKIWCCNTNEALFIFWF